LVHSSLVCHSAHSSASRARGHGWGGSVCLQGKALAETEGKEREAVIKFHEAMQAQHGTAHASRCCTARHRTARHFKSLHCTALHRTALHRTAPHCTALHCTARLRASHHCYDSAVHGTALQLGRTLKVWNGMAVCATQCSRVITHHTVSCAAARPLHVYCATMLRCSDATPLGCCTLHSRRTLSLMVAPTAEQCNLRRRRTRLTRWATA
jgi:hypothetical protein